MAVSGAAHLGAWRALIALSAALSAALAPASASAQSPRFDLVIRNGLVVDGNGAPPYRGDIAITGDRIARVAPRIDEAAVRVIDAGGKVLAPGFIDVHTHVRAGIFITPTADNYVYQGVTTLIEGPDGNSPVPLAPFFIRLEALAKTVNIGSFIGHGSVREAVIGRDDRRASSEELKRMRALVEQGMRDGAFGLSSGLIYVPGLFAPTEEIVELAKVAGRLGGHYQTHIRNESGHAVDAVREAIAIGEQAKIPVQITHHKLVGRRAWGMSVDTLREIDAARARGQDVTIDQYPYTGVGGNFFATLVPADLTAGGRKQLLLRLQDHAVRARLTAVIERKLRASGGRPYLDRVVISRCDFDESLAGQSIAELTRQRH